MTKPRFCDKITYVIYQTLYLEVNMPPKVKITKEDIINKGVELVRENGEDAINARGIATALGCSTQPIFSNFESMEDLKEQIIFSAYKPYLGFIEAQLEENKYPPYKAYGMAYIRFAREEKNLFKLLFMRDRTGEDLSPSPDFEQSVEIIMKSNNLSREIAMLLHLEMWACVHGIGVMMATSFLELDEELISRIISDIYLGVRAKHVSEVENECN